MDLQAYLDKKSITRYRLSKISGIPKTTVTDICSEKVLYKIVQPEQFFSLQRHLVVQWRKL